MLTVPLRLIPLITIVTLSLVLAVCLKVPPFGLPLAIILLSWLFKYSYDFLDALIVGRTEPPVLSVEIIKKSAGEWRSLMPLILVTAAFFISGVATFLYGIVIAVVLVTPLLIVLPAVVAIQAWTGSLNQSLSPKLCRRMAVILGNDYPQIVAASMAIALIAAVAESFADRVWLPTRVGIFVYAWLAIIAMTGKAVHRHRTRLEAETLFIVPVEVDNTEQLLVEARQSWLDTIYAEARGGAHGSAWQTALRRLDDVPEPLHELRWLYRAVANWNFPDLTNRIAAEIIGRLLDHNHQAEAIELTRERLSADATFRPRRATDTLRLTMIMGRSADRRTALQLLERFDDYYPNDALRAKAARLRDTLQHA
jgi:hypothetical protein